MGDTESKKPSEVFHKKWLNVQE